MCYGVMENDPDKVSGSEVIQFTEDIFPEKLDELGELSIVADLLERSKRGIKFTNPPSVERICRMMRHIDHLSGVKRVFALLRILEILGRMKDYKLLTSGDYSANLVGEDDNDPVNKVYRYLNNNFKEAITLDQIASYVGFNPSALCRYFKKRAQKSIFECLVEIRIGFACKLIANSSLNISQIAYNSGYHNIANFNRQFKRLTGYAPSEYAKIL